VAVEINSVRDGVLESHVVFEYDRRADAAMVRRRMRSETRLPGEAGHRARTVVEFTNLRMGGQ
jgi:superfamily II helicase